MNAIHVNWTKPHPERFSEDFEILTTVLSALKWREKNGSIGLVTDTFGAEFYKSCGLDIIWDNGIDICLDDITAEINSSVFWAAGKIFALARQTAPIAVLDTDFIVWDSLPFDSYSDIAVIHFEELNSDIYPNMEYFKMKNSFEHQLELDWNAKPCNTAFYIIKDNRFIKEYTSEAIRFMKNAAYTDDALRYMVFAEQRLFGMCAEDVMEISDLKTLFNGSTTFTHIWGMKQQMRDMPELRHSFCRLCIDRLIRDYPYIKPVIEGVGCLAEYFK